MRFLRIADHLERDILLVRADRFRRRMKHDHFLDAGSFDLSRAPPGFGDVRVANRPINEAPELQMDEALCIGEVYGLPSRGLHRRPRQHVSWLEFHGFTSRFSDSRPIHR